MLFPAFIYKSVLSKTPDSLKIMLADTTSKISIDDPARLENFLLAMDGQTSLTQLTNQYQFTETVVKQLVDALGDVGMIKMADKPNAKIIEASDFAKLCRHVFPQWKEQVFTHAFWQRLTDGKASKAEFAGWLLENFYFIEGATKRLSTVTSAVNDNKAIRQHFSTHFVEEFNHHLFFLKALNRLGISKEQVLMHKPLPSTIAIINHMRECGRRDAISYAACSAFLESTGGDRSVAMQFFDALAMHYDKDNLGIIKPLVDHALLDEEYGHNDWLEKVCCELPIMTVERANKALQSAEVLVETLTMWTKDMQKHYEQLTFEDIVNPTRYR